MITARNKIFAIIATKQRLVGRVRPFMQSGKNLVLRKSDQCKSIYECLVNAILIVKIAN